MATHNLIATVSSVTGEVFVRDSEGMLHQLKVGDRLFEGDVVIPSNGGLVELMMADGRPMTLDQPVEVTLSQEMLADEQPAAKDDAITDESVAAVLEALESGGDPTAVLPPPAAGAAADEGHDFIRLARIVEEITPNAFPGDALAAADDDLLSPDLLDQQNEAPFAEANNYDVTEEGSISGNIITDDTGSGIDSDPEGDSLSIASVNGQTLEFDAEGNAEVTVGDGILTINGDGAFNYEHNGDEPAETSFSYTVTDGNQESNTATVTLNVAPENDAPTIDVIANDFVEDDESNIEGVVAGTYTTADEDGDNLTVTFTAGTNSEGYYALDTDNNEVTLTQAGVDQVNSGGDLTPIDLTVTDDGDPNLTGQDEDMPEVATVNDVPTIDVTANDFVEDDEGNVEGVVAGTYTTADEDGDNLTVTFTEGTNSEGYYALDTDNSEVTLTQAGVDQVNSGGVLPPIDLTVTDDGDPNLTGQDEDTPEVTTVNDAPTIDVTANDFVEDDEGNVEGAVAGTYTTADEDGDNLTVTFTEGTNSEGYYALDTDNNQVTLTQAGVDQVNSGGDLPPIDLTVTDDGDPNLTGQDEDTPEVTTVNDAPTIDVTANDFVEDDEGNVEGAVAGTYTTADEDGDNLTVTFTEGTNSEGYYVLDTDNNQVTLTQAGVDQVNSGGDLPPIDLTVTDDGDPNLTGQDEDTPEVTTVNDAPTIDVTANDFVEDDEGNVEGVVAGTYTTADEDGDNLTVTFTEGTNSEGYYALDTDNNQVTLTEAGVAQVNSGGALPPIDLTVTDDGDPNLTGQDEDTPGVTTVNDAPTIDVTANDFVEDDPESTYEGAVAGIYTTADEEGDNLTVTFTEGTNSEGYYALDTDNNQVTLTEAGVAQVNSGGALPPIDLTVTDDGDPNLTGQDEDTPGVTTVNDAPTIDVTANDFVEGDEGNVEGVVAGTYTTADEDGDNLTVTFTEGTNSEGYYALDTDNNEVTLTQAGVDRVNSGGDLPPIDLTVTDDGDPNLTGRDTDTPEVDSLVHLDMTDSGGTVDDVGLLSDTDNSETTSGSFFVDAPDGLDYVSFDGEEVDYEELIASNTTPHTVITNNPGAEILKITGYNESTGEISYTYTLLEPVHHDVNNDDFKIRTFEVIASDGVDTDTDNLVITQIDDAPVIHSVTDGTGLNDAGVINGLLEVKTSADDPVVFNWNAGDVVITNSEGGPITLYAEGQLVEISPPDDETQTITGTAGGETVFTLTLSEDFSSYIYEQYMPVAVLVEDVAIIGDLSGGNSETFHFQATSGPAEAPLVTTFYGFEFDPDAGSDGAFAASTVNTSSQSMGVGTGQNIDDDGDAEDHLFISFDGGLVTEFSFSLIDPGNKGEDLWYIAYTADDLPFDLEALDDEGFSYQESDLTGDRTTLEVGSILSNGSETLTFEEPVVFIVFGSDSESGGSSYKLVPNSLTADYFSEELTFNLSAPFTLTDEDSDSTSESIELSIIGNGDNLTGDEFDNALGGNERANTLTGGEGNDVLTGGKGDDTLIGDDPLTDTLGSDTFVWNLNDGGNAGDPAVDLITDFDGGLPGSGGDILDLRDLLVGEDNDNLDNLTDYLHFSSDGTDSVLHISSSGSFTGLELDTTVVDQVIEFNGVDLVGDLTTQNDIIDNLLQSGNLITD